MHFEYFCATDTGLKREHNEDAVAFDALSGVVVLADGIGGYNAGEVASGMATAGVCSELAGLLMQYPDINAIDLEKQISLSVQSINLSIFNRAQSVERYQGMGTTIIVGVFQQETLTVAHVGDSRAYRLREQKLQKLTKDHSIAQQQVDLGLIAESEMESMRGKNMVTRAVGVEPLISVDVLPHLIEVDDVYLFCSDGLSDLVPLEKMQSILLKSFPSLREAAYKLIEAANTAGGRDNISVILVRVHASDA